jgi:hypothetical protein
MEFYEEGEHVASLIQNGHGGWVLPVVLLTGCMAVCCMFCCPKSGVASFIEVGGNRCGEVHWTPGDSCGCSHFRNKDIIATDPTAIRVALICAAFEHWNYIFFEHEE